jgi:hypothetical protein
VALGGARWPGSGGGASELGRLEVGEQRRAVGSRVVPRGGKGGEGPGAAAAGQQLPGSGD